MFCPDRDPGKTRSRRAFRIDSFRFRCILTRKVATSRRSKFCVPGEIVNEHEREVSLHIGVDGLRIPRLPSICLLLASVVLLAVSLANAADGAYVVNNTPAYVSSAKKLGPAVSTSTIDVTLWLQPHNRSGLDALARELYDPNSPNFRHWLKSSEIAAQFGPTAAEAKTVEDFFSSNNLKVTRVGPSNFYVRAQGTV